jgi:hypothetical protein
MSIGMRVLLAPRNDVSADDPAGCTGPCDTPTPRTKLDRAIALSVTAHFGS